MELLFKREQSSGKGGNAAFKLWGKIELTEDEQAITERYKFDRAVLIDPNQTGLMGQSIFYGSIVAVIAALIAFDIGYGMVGVIAGVLIGLVTGVIWYDRHREKILVKDLLHGRHFKCFSVIDLAKKEMELEGLVGMLRQVMEAAKHWDGTDRRTVDPLPPEEAKRIVAEAH